MRNIWTAAKRKVSGACVISTTSSRESLFDPFSFRSFCSEIFFFFLFYFLLLTTHLNMGRAELFEWVLVDEIRWDENLTCVMKMIIWFSVSHSIFFSFFKRSDFLIRFIFHSMSSVAHKVGIPLHHVFIPKIRKLCSIFIVKKYFS